MKLGQDLTHEDRTAVVQKLNSTLRTISGSLHGEDSEGLADIEFRHLGCAFQWIAETGTFRCVTWREAPNDLHSPVVIQIYLYDFAKAVGMLTE